MVNFTTINHEARTKLKLSWLEYGLADLIYNLSNSPKTEYPNWCYASKEKMAELLGTSKQTVHTIINKLVKLGLLERHPDTKHLKITIDWYEEVLIKRDSKETLLPVKKLDSDSKETLPQVVKKLYPTHIYNKDINNKGGNTPDNITLEDIQEIADKYKVSVGFVNLELEKMKNWLKSSGKVKKDYKATLRNFVLDDMQKHLERRQNGDNKRGADLSALG